MTKPIPALSPARLAAFALLVVPAILLAWSARDIWLTYSSTPFADQWVEMHRWPGAPSHGWLRYLISSHNEHRIFFPRLVFLADWKWTQGRGVINLAAVGLVQLGGAALFLRMVKGRALGAIGLLALAVALGLMVCMIQWENFFWGFQVQFVGVYAAGAWAIWLFCQAGAGKEEGKEEGGVRWAALAGALALLLIATFNMANGALAGVAMTAVGLITRRPRRATVVMAVATILLLGGYMIGYRHVEHTASPGMTLHHPARFLTYICAYLGGIWWPGRTDKAILTGILGIGLSLAMLVIMARRGGRDTARSTLLGVVLFVCASATLTAFGRLVFGTDQALISRYTTPTAYFWAAQALFWALTLQDSPRPIVRHDLGLVLLLLLSRIPTLQLAGESQVINMRSSTLFGTSALLGGIDDNDALKSLFTEPADILGIAPYLRATHLTLFADPPVAVVGAPFTRQEAKQAICLGAFDSVAPTSGKPWRALGWGWDRAARRPIARIVLVDGAGTVIGIGAGGGLRRDVDRTVHEVTLPIAGWAAILNRGAGADVTAYGITAKGQACLLGRKSWPQ